MPTFTAIALDRLIEPGASKSMAPAKNVPDSRLERRNSTPSSRLDRGISVPPRLEKRSSLPKSKSESKNGPSAMAVDRNNHWTQISPVLYATPKSTPIPDSPSSYPPSPYIINHKRRGPSLLKSFSEVDVATSQQASDEKKEDVNFSEVDVATSQQASDEKKEDETAKDTEKKATSLDDNSVLRGAVDSAKDNHFPSAVCSPVKEEYENGTLHCVKEEHGNGNISPVKEHVIGTYSLVEQEHVNGTCAGEIQGFELTNGSAGQSDTGKSVLFNLQQVGEFDDFLDPQDSTSVKSNTECDANGGLERSMNLATPMAVATPMAEFYDAWEELSSETALQPPIPDFEAELREIRLSILMEIEKRKQAEEALNNMQTQWQRIRSQLSSVGLTLPADPLAVAENEQLDDPAEELSRQVYLARFVSNSIGRGTAKAEVETEMEAQLELKNFEIARLCDRLHYYEAVNREMSQRNQEAVDTARRLRQRRKRRQRWVWGSIAAAITLGSAVLAWSYLSTGKGTSSSNQSHASEGDHASEN